MSTHEHVLADKNPINRTETGQNVTRSHRFSKDQSGYWRNRLRQRSYLYKGQLCKVSGWQVRMHHHGQECWFNIETTNREAAAATARDIHVFIKAQGLEAARAKFKGGGEICSDNPTVREYLAAVGETSGIKPGTLTIYARKFRTLIAGVFGIRGGVEKHDYVAGGYAKWLRKVDSVRLHKLTPERISAWRNRYVAARATNPQLEQRAKRSVNSILRSSMSLFGPRAVENIRLSVQSPFAGVSLYAVKIPHYTGDYHPEVLLVAAHNELATPQPEAYKILILALCGGLRRDEIDTLKWDQLDMENATIRIESNEYTSAKNAASEAVVNVDPEMLRTLFRYKQGSASSFVIKSNVSPKSSPRYHHYRCQRHFDCLVKWLRTKGVVERNAIHAMRKEFGSTINKLGGIFAASTQLRHSDIRTTRNSYLNQGNRVVVTMPVPDLQVVQKQAQN